MQCSVYITRKATLPVELERGPEVKNPIVQDQEIEEFEGLGEKMKLMLEVQNEMFSKAGSNIQWPKKDTRKIMIRRESWIRYVLVVLYCEVILCFL